MKKTILSVITLFFITISYAQDTETVTTTTIVRPITTSTQEENGFEKGNVFISGGINFSSIDYSRDTPNVTNFEIFTKIGAFTADNFALGINIGYQNGDSENIGANSDILSKTFIVGIFTRQYFQPTQKFSLFLEENINYITTTVESIYYGYSSSIEEDRYKGFAIGITPGISYFLNKHFALEASWGILQYTTIKLDVEEDEVEYDSTDNFSIGLSFEDINFSLLYKF